MMIALEWPAFGDAAKAKNADFLRLIAFLALSFVRQICQEDPPHIPPRSSLAQFAKKPRSIRSKVPNKRYENS